MSRPDDQTRAQGDAYAQQPQQMRPPQEQPQPVPAGQSYPQQPPAYGPAVAPPPPPGQPAPSYLDPRDSPAGSAGARRGPGLADGAARFAREQLRTLETKDFFRTSEFVLTIFAAVVLILAAAIQETFNAPQMWRLCTALFVAYILSRGIAKAGSNRGGPGNRD